MSKQYIQYVGIQLFIIKKTEFVGNWPFNGCMIGVWYPFILTVNSGIQITHPINTTFVVCIRFTVIKDIPLMWQVPRPALNHAAGCVHVHPQHEAQERPLQAVVYIAITQDVHQVRNGEHHLTDGLYEAIFTL